MRHPILALVLSLLAGCLGGGGGGGGGGSSSAPAFPTVTVSGLNTTSVVTHAGTYDVTIGGSGNTVTIGLNQTVRNLTVGGISPDVYIGSSSTVSGTVTLGGTNPVLHLPPGSPITVNPTGIGAQVLYDSVAG